MQWNSADLTPLIQNSRLNHPKMSKTFSAPKFYRSKEGGL